MSAPETKAEREQALNQQYEDLFAYVDNAEAVRKIREWCVSAASMTCSHTTEAECRRCEVIKDCALAVRALLPEVPA